MLHPQIMSQWEMMENLFKFTYLPHQLLGAMELQNIIAGLSKDNELKKKPFHSDKHTLQRFPGRV